MEKKLQCRRAYRSDCIGTVKLIDGKPLCTRHTLKATRTTNDSESRRRRRLPIVLGAIALIATITASVALTALFTRRDSEQHSIVTQTVVTTKPMPKAANSITATTPATTTTTTKRRYTVTYTFAADSPTITVWYTGPQGNIGPVNYTGIANEGGYQASITQTFDTLPNKLSLHAQSNGQDNFAWCMVLINGVHKSEHSNEGNARTASCNLRRH